MIDLREFIGVLRRRKGTVIVTTLVVMGLALAMVARRQAVYTSTARAEVRPLTAAADQYGFYDLQSSMDTEAERVSSTR